MKAIAVGGQQPEVPILRTLAEFIHITSIVVSRDGQAIADAAKNLGIPVAYECSDLGGGDADLIIDLSGSKSIASKIRKDRPTAQVIDLKTAQIICDLVRTESKATHDIINTLTRENRALYEIGMSLVSTGDLSEAYITIVQQALKLIEAPGGSIGIYDESSGSIACVGSQGFGKNTGKHKIIRVPAGHFTQYVLSQKSPIVVPDVTHYPDFDHAEIAQAGIRSLIACPLILADRAVGILFVGDYRIREFTAIDVSVLFMLSNYAVLAIEKARLLQNLTTMVVTDDLTKLNNYRGLTQQLEKEFKRAKRYKEQLSLILIDIDRFKWYNDTHGHLKGNDLLVEFASILRQESRASDTVARYGGEEFIIICPKTDKQSAYQLVDRIRDKIDKRNFTCSCENG